MQTTEAQSPRPASGTLDDKGINAELARILASDEFSRSPRLQQMLTFIVTETLEGRADRIKGMSIALDVFGQTDPEVARTSTIVSVEARRLRRKLGDYYLGVGALAPIVIEIPKGTFVPVFRQSGTVKTLETTTISPQLDTVSPKPKNFLTYALAVAISLTMALTWVLTNRASTGPNTANVFERPAIAIIPFRNLTGSLQSDGFASGMAEDITADLAKLREIDVISYSSASLLTSPDMPPQEIGKVLQVSHILQGSIRGKVPNIRINAELLDALSGKLIWADRFDGNLGDPLKLQDEIAAKVVNGLPVGLSGWSPGHNTTQLTTDPETTALFDQAMGLANPPSDNARLKIAQLAFQAVIQADPAFAGGYAGVAYIGAFKALWGHVPDSQAEAAASADMAKRALDVDPNSALALDALALSLLVIRDFDAAVETSELAIQLAPNDPYVQSYHAFILTADGQAAAAIPFAQRAVRLNPLDPRTPFRNILGVVQLHAGNYDQAIRSFSENDRMKGPQSLGHQANLAAAFAGIGDTRQAARIAAELPNGFGQGRWLEWHKRNFRQIEDALRIPALLQSIH